jgi:fatty acid elongase 3
MVHVVMYWYYFQSARGIKIWWKKYITMLQIIQFVIDLGFVYFASYTYFSARYFAWLPTMGICAGEEFAAFAGMGILSSYLFLFIGFYISTYKKPVKKGRGRATSALVEMKDEQVPSARDVQRRLSGGASTLQGYSSAKENGSTATTTGTPARVTRSRKA